MSTLLDPATPATAMKCKDELDESLSLKEERDASTSQSPSNSDRNPSEPEASSQVGQARPVAVESARDWSTCRKSTTVVFVAIFAFLSTFAASMIAPGRAKIQHEMHLSTTVSVLPFSLFNLGLALGSIIGSPASETYGRKPVYLVCMPTLLIFVMGSGFSRDLASLLVCRFLGGLCGSPALTIASATISDMFEPAKRGLPMFCYWSMPWIGSVLGPLIGYLVVSHFDWTWTQWVYLFIAVPIVLPGLIFLRETKQSVLEARAQRTTKEALSPTSIMRGAGGAARTISTFLRTSLLRPAQMLCSETIVFLVCCYAGFNFGLIYALIVALPDIFARTYGFNYTEQGLSFLGLIVGCMIGPISLIIDDKIVRRHRQRLADAETQSTKTVKHSPESRLHGSMFGGIILPIGLLWFGWTARPDISYLSPIFASVLITWGALTVYVSTSAYMVDTYGPRYGASANGASSITRYTLASAIPLFILPMYNGLGNGWATSVLALCAGLMMPIPFVFYKFGPQLRQRCKYQTE